jgi:hypothetical protein
MLSDNFGNNGVAQLKEISAYKIYGDSQWIRMQE